MKFQINEDNASSMKKNETTDYYWVGIGASAGGLEAIQLLCSSLPENANMIYIVAQHLSPKHNSALTQLIRRNAKLETETITNGITARPNVIYVTPPQNDVSIENGKIYLSPIEDISIPKPSVNNLFVSLAENVKEHAIGVLLSGTGSDGAYGAKIIRANGGITFAQEPSSAAYDGMPTAAIQTNCVDLILKPKQISEQLKRISSQISSALSLALEKAEVRDAFTELMALIQHQCGVSFKQYKKATLKRRIERRMLACDSSSFENYVDLLKQNPEEVHLLYKEILISVTSFFRDQESFFALNDILSEIVKRKAPHEPLRLWVAGCATGEEAYSLGILLAEVIGGPAHLVDRNYQIFATDVDTDALNVARKGIYYKASLNDVPDKLVRKYFHQRKDSTYEVIKELKSTVLFASHNVIDDPPFLRIDMVTCRNLLIYFEQELQKKIYNIFHYSLVEKGYLFLGKSESTTQVTEHFRPAKSKERIFQKRSISSNYPNRYFIRSQNLGSDSTIESKLPEPAKIPKLPDILIEQLSDAAVLINDNLNIEHTYGDASHYLKITRGRPSLNIAEIIIEAFKHEVRPIVFKVLRTKKAVFGQTRKVSIDGETYSARLRVLPVQVDEAADRYLIICFEKLEKPESSSNLHDNIISNEHVKELEDELTMAREHLQTVIEELETSNEELQSMNEELQSSNEELQSSNEELQTTNEEMQSANEELVTMNDELTSKTTALELATTHLVNIKNSISFPLIYIDKRNRIIKANAQSKELFHITEEEQYFFELLPPEFRQFDIQSIIEDVTATGKPKQEQLEKQGRFYWLHITPYRKSNDEMDGVILSFIDNTESVKQKHELIASRKKALDATLTKSEFLANVSHEIRTPLNAIIGVNEILRVQIDDPEKRPKLLSILNNSTSNLKELLDDLLDFSKLEAGKLCLDINEFSIREIIDKIVNVFSLKASEKGVKVNVDVQKNVPDLLLGDCLRVQQILSNLFSNAVKFTQNGSVNIRIEGKVSQDICKLKLIVQDTGIGMDKNQTKRVFEKFTQSDTSISRRYGGTGLGLSIVKELVDLMDGRVSVESNPGLGSTFIVTLPLPLAQTKPCQNTKNKKKSNGEKTISRANLQPVLLVEDNQSNVYIFTSYLEQLGIKYDVANDGYEALDMVRKNHYPIIFLDLQMDGMSGFQFYEHFKDLEQTDTNSETRVIAVSAHVHSDIIKQCEEAGMDDFIPKPVDINKLKDALNHTL